MVGNRGEAAFFEQSLILNTSAHVSGNFTRRQSRRLHFFTAKRTFCNFTSLPPLSSEALREGGSSFQKKRGILRLENTGFFEQSVILTHPPPSGATSQGGKAAVFTSSLQTQVLQLHIYCSRWSQPGEYSFLSFCVFFKKNQDGVLTHRCF